MQATVTGHIQDENRGYAFRKQILGLVAGLRMPAIYRNTDFVEDGGLISYASNFRDLARRAAVYADKIIE